MNIDDLTLGQIKDIQALLSGGKIKEKKENPFVIGESYFIRTVTYHLTGRLKKIVGNFLILEDAAWIADSGRFKQAINDGVLNEVEPVKVCPLINIESITDAFPWFHDLPREQK